MSLLTPFTALLAAAIAIPALLLLYFLKLRRRYLRIASTLLWRQSYEDLEVNAPFQRLRWSALLALQLATLLALLFALAQPIIQGEGHSAARLILVIDRSASMRAADALDGQIRLEAAKQAARNTLDRLGRGGEAREVMVIAFGATAHVVSTFQFDRSALLAAIDSIEPTDEEANLAAALQLAAGFAGHTEAAGDQAAEIVLISDGNVEQPDDPAGFRLRSGSFRFVRVGPPDNQPVNNIGIASFSARRDYDDPTRVLVFARLVNAGPSEVAAVLTLRSDGEAIDVRRITVPPAQNEGPSGEAPITFAIDYPEGGVLTLEHNYSDALSTDDRAYLVLAPPVQPRIAVVNGEPAPEDDRIVPLFRNFDPSVLRAYTPEQFAEYSPRDLDAGALYDLVIFSRISGHRLPGVPSITFGGTPRGVGEIEPASPGGKRILSWDRQHPIMRQVSLDPVVYAGFGGYALPTGATTLAIGPDGPVIATLGTRGARHVLVGFPLDLSRTNWPLHVSVVVFAQNVMDHLMLAGAGGGQGGLVHRPGAPITVRARPDVREVTLSTIDGAESEQRITIEPGGMRTLPAMRTSGVYRVAGVNPPMDRIAVSMLSDRESDIRPRSRLIVNAETTVAGSADEVVPRELWPWVVALGLILLVIEWLAYCRKAR